MIHFLFLSTQSYSLLIVLFIDHYYFLSVCLFIVAVSAFVFVYGRYWCLCACLTSELVSLSSYFVIAICGFVLVCQCFCLVSGYS